MLSCLFFSDYLVSGISTITVILPSKRLVLYTTILVGRKLSAIPAVERMAAGEKEPVSV